MRNYRNILSVFMICFSFFATSCGSAPAVIDTPAEFSGTISNIQPNPIEGFQGWITVESPTPQEAGIYKVTINDDTAIFILDEGKYDFVDFEALELNQQVDLWFSMLYLDAIPAEAVAEQVVILH